MKLLCFLFSFILLFDNSLTATGQLANSFNYNIENGMPSNHIYGVLTDRHGYLWIGTDKGAVRYNGYEFRVFNQLDGIANEDIWELFEDKKGRLWLSNISDEFGYILNNKYHRAFIKGVNYTVYPREVRNLGNGIVFYSSYLSGDGEGNICFEMNDTIYRHGINECLSSWIRERNAANGYISLIHEDGMPIIISENRVYAGSLQNGKIEMKFRFKIADSSFISERGRNFTGIAGNYIISYPVSVKSNKFFVVNLSTGTSEKVDLSTLSGEDYINYIYADIYGDQDIFVITNNNILRFECKDKVKYLGSYDLKDILDKPGVNAGDIRTLHLDRFWETSIGTTTNGLWLNYNAKNHFLKESDLDLHDYKYKGGKKYSISFWWNDAKATLARIDGNWHADYFKYDYLKKTYAIAQFHDDTFLLCSVQNYFLNNRTAGVTIPKQNFPGNVFAALFDSAQNCYMATFYGFVYATVNGDGSVNNHYIDHDRYNGLLYDSTRRNYWAYNFDKVIIHGINTDTVITRDKISSFGVRKIEKIVVDDKYGNIFFKGGDNITIYNYEKNVYRELFGNFNLKESVIAEFNSTLILAGRFGVLFCKILGDMRISEPLLYPNIKNRNYNSISDCEVLRGHLLLNTDKGTFKVAIPSDSEILNSTADSMLFRYKFILNYADTVIDFRSGDTIPVTQKDQRLQFDVINILGNGHVKYACKLSGDTAWHDLNANELTLPSSLAPDNYYDLRLKVYDNVWRSDEIVVHLYITPYWYQTHTMIRAIWAGSVLLIFLVFMAVVLITRRLVLRASLRRNLRMELELKSIYAQINPHFIFNTLNSALLLVSKNKMEEAYTHISRFSRLLRAYIKSSRNKLISIADEITNLKDYMDLQQMRFKNKFEYEIIVTPAIDPQQIMIPSLLLQPFVENAINHGILLKKEIGHVRIEFSLREEENVIFCTIEDDGVGRRVSGLVEKSDDIKSDSYGDLMIRDLVSIFNKFESMNIEIEVADKELPLTGTIVTIRIKNPRHAG